MQLCSERVIDYLRSLSVNGLHASLCKNPRTLELFTLLVKHLHAFGREAQPTHAEWAQAIAFLTAAGKESTTFKNEFVLISDCLGFSALVDEINHPKPPVRVHARLVSPPDILRRVIGLHGELRAWPFLHGRRA